MSHSLPPWDPRGTFINSCHFCHGVCDRHYHHCLGARKALICRVLPGSSMSAETEEGKMDLVCRIQHSVGFSTHSGVLELDCFQNKSAICEGCLPTEGWIHRLILGKFCSDVLAHFTQGDFSAPLIFLRVFKQ